MLGKALQKRRLCLWAIGVLLIIIVATLQYYFFRLGHQRLEQSVQERLLTAASAAEYFYGSHYHAGLNPSSIGLEQDYTRSQALTAFAQQLNVSYVYSLALIDGKIRFISSSLTPEEVNDGNFDAVYWTEYRDAPPELGEVFNSMENVTAHYQDQWGEFMSVFVPFIASDGSSYVVGVDISTEHLKQEAALGSALTMIPIAVTFFTLVPLFLLLIRANIKRNQAELHAAYTDGITGLSNRNQLALDLEYYEKPALVLINIDQFREVANTFGIAFGDKILSEYAYFLQCYSGVYFSIEKVYRLQGAEFAVLIRDGDALIASDTAIEDFRRYCNWFQYHLEDGSSLALSVTLGIASSDVDALLLADTALRHAKVHKRDCVVYNRELTTFDMYKRNLHDVQQLRDALIEQRLVPYFQPVFRIDDHRLVRYEVLARIEGADGEVTMMPNDFIPIAERYRLNRQLAVSIIKKTLVLMADNSHHVSFNLSIRDIENPATAQRILELVKRSGMADRLSFELLENEAMRNRNSVIKFFVRLRRMGCRVGIDDLGKEYSNFDRLVDLPLDFVKIDGGVIHHALRDKATLDILTTFVQAAKGCGLETIAECVDSEKVAALVRGLDVEMCQGFFYGIPTSRFDVMPSKASTETVVA